MGQIWDTGINGSLISARAIMATISKRGDGQWQSKIRKKGYPTQSKTFTTKAQAEKWSRLVESEMDRGIFLSTTEAENTKLSDLIYRYTDEIIPTKKSQRAILSRLKTVGNAMGHLALAAITPLTVKEFRDYRLESVSTETVRKELSIISILLNTCQKEWGIYLPRGNPVKSITMPPPCKARDRRLEEKEEQELIKAAEEYGGLIADIIIIAINTGMRRSEISNLKWKNIDLKKRTAKLFDTKNGGDRTIPLHSDSISILDNQARNINGYVFNIRPDSITQAFERVCDKAKIQNLRFHDLRHEATSRFFEMGLNMMEVSSITGHKDLAMLKRYTHLKAEDLAKKMK